MGSGLNESQGLRDEFISLFAVRLCAVCSRLTVAGFFWFCVEVAS